MIRWCAVFVSAPYHNLWLPTTNTLHPVFMRQQQQHLPGFQSPLTFWFCFICCFVLLRLSRDWCQLFTAKATFFSVFYCMKCQYGKTCALLVLLCNLAGVYSKEPAPRWSGWPMTGPGKATSPAMATFRLTHTVSPKTLWNNYFYGFFFFL